MTVAWIINRIKQKLLTRFPQHLEASTLIYEYQVCEGQ